MTPGCVLPTLSPNLAGLLVCLLDCHACDGHAGDLHVCPHVHRVRASDLRPLFESQFRDHVIRPLAPRHRVHDGEPCRDVCACAVHGRFAVSPKTQSLKNR